MLLAHLQAQGYVNTRVEITHKGMAAARDSRKARMKANAELRELGMTPGAHQLSYVQLAAMLPGGPGGPVIPAAAGTP